MSSEIDESNTKNPMAKKKSPAKNGYGLIDEIVDDDADTESTHLL